jgi:hypothetical protein
VVYPRPGVASWADPLKILPPQPLATSYNLRDSTGVLGLRILATVCRARGATFMIIPAARAMGEAAVKRQFLTYAEEREADMIALAQRMGAVALLGPGQTTVEPQYTFDTLYHLNDAGVAVVQKRLVAALKPWVEKMQRPPGGDGK